MAEKRKMVLGVFRDRMNAERAFDYLHSMGYSDREINVLMSDQTRAAHYGKEERSKLKAGNMMEEGTAIGGAIGTAVGAALGAAVAIGTSIAIPGLGLVIAGPIVAGLAGAGAGGITGGLIGMLAGLGITEENAQAYHEALRAGGVVIGVVPRHDDHADAIQEKFEELDGENVCYC